MDELNNPIRPCTSVDGCLDICASHPSACEAPVQATKIQSDGVWSREQQNNPFADYFKVSFLVKNIFSLHCTDVSLYPKLV